MVNETSEQETDPVTGPSEDLAAFERLIGTWTGGGSSAERCSSSESRKATNSWRLNCPHRV